MSPWGCGGWEEPRGSLEQDEPGVGPETSQDDGQKWSRCGGDEQTESQGDTKLDQAVQATEAGL